MSFSNSTCTVSWPWAVPLQVRLPRLVCMISHSVSKWLVFKLGKMEGHKNGIKGDRGLFFLFQRWRELHGDQYNSVCACCETSCSPEQATGKSASFEGATLTAQVSRSPICYWVDVGNLVVSSQKMNWVLKRAYWFVYKWDLVKCICMLVSKCKN